MISEEEFYTVAKELSDKGIPVRVGTNDHGMQYTVEFIGSKLIPPKRDIGVACESLEKAYDILTGIRMTDWPT